MLESSEKVIELIKVRITLKRGLKNGKTKEDVENYSVSECMDLNNDGRRKMEEKVRDQGEGYKSSSWQLG